MIDKDSKITDMDETIRDTIGYLKMVSALTYIHLTHEHKKTRNFYEEFYHPWLLPFRDSNALSKSFIDYAFREAADKYDNFFGKPKYHAPDYR